MAVSITAVELRVVLLLEDDHAGNAEAVRLLAVATALVDKEGAEEAPDPISNESVLRVAGYIHQQPSSTAVFSGMKAGGDAVDLMFRSPATSAVRLSGARALLSSWKSRGVA